MKATRDASIAAVIPTRNRPEMVCAAVRSALAQTTAPVEVIVIIDGPDPRTVAALAQLQAAEPDGRLCVVALAQPVGGAEARNIGVRRARAQWIAFLDDDDLWLPQKLAVQLQHAETSTAEHPVLASAVLARSPRGETVWPRRLYQAGEPMAEYLFCREGWTYGAALLQTSTLFAPREFLLRIPFTSGLKKHQDWDWLLRASADPEVEITQLPAPLAVFHVEGARTSVSRAPDWHFSVHWAAQQRDLFTPRAFSAFLATECAPQAALAGATWEERYALFSTVMRRGSPTLKVCLLCLGFLVLPQKLRRWLRDLRATVPTRHEPPATPVLERG